MTKLVRHTYGGAPTILDEVQDMMNYALNDSVFGPEFTKNFFGINFDKHAYPKTDIIDEADNLVFEIDVQGLKKEDVSVNLEPSDYRGTKNLVISGGKKNSKADDERKYIRKEIKRSSWRRSWSIDETLYDSERISADVVDGLLVVKIPKIAEENRKSLVTKIL